MAPKAATVGYETQCFLASFGGQASGNQRLVCRTTWGGNIEKGKGRRHMNSKKGRKRGWGAYCLAEGSGRSNLPTRKGIYRPYSNVTMKRFIFLQDQETGLEEISRHGSKCEMKRNENCEM